MGAALDPNWGESRAGSSFTRRPQNLKRGWFLFHTCFIRVSYPLPLPAFKYPARAINGWMAWWWGKGGHGRKHASCCARETQLHAHRMDVIILYTHIHILSLYLTLLSLCFIRQSSSLHLSISIYLYICITIPPPCTIPSLPY